MLLVEGLHFADRLLSRLRQMKRDADRQVLAKLEIVTHRVSHPVTSLDRALRHRRPAASDQPLDPWRIMNSMPRVLALTIGCQHSTGRLTGRGTRVSSLS
jgi:hypothetical protein